MKFKYAFKAHKSIIRIGTHLISEIPGLVKIKSEANTLWFYFPWEDNPVWKYVPTTEIVDDWNTVSLVGDDVKITLSVNGNVHTIVDSSNVATFMEYSGFSSSNSIVLAHDFPQVNSCDIIVLATSNDVSSTGVLLAKYTSPEQYFSVSGSTSKPAYYISGWTDGVTSIETNKTYWYRVVSDQDKNFNYYILPYDGSTIDTLPELSSWTYQCKTSTDIFSNSQFAIGYNRNATSEYWKGTISKVLITLNDTTVFDSDSAVEGVDFENNGCTIRKITTGPVYPIIKTGKLNTYANSWLVLKDIQAIKIEE